MKFAANFPLTINNNTISLLDTEATISCMSKACFDKLQPKSALVQTHTYKVNDANNNSVGPLRTTTCNFEFPKKFQQQFIVCKHLLHPVILGLHFLHNYLIGIDWFSTNQLHFCLLSMVNQIQDEAININDNFWSISTLHNNKTVYITCLQFSYSIKLHIQYEIYLSYLPI